MSLFVRVFVMVDTFTFIGLIIFQLTFASSTGHNSTRTGLGQLLLITVCPALAQRLLP